MHLGLVTYNLGREWDIETMIGICQETGFEGVELRTTHAHNVEDALTAAERAKVKSQFADSDVTLVGLGSAFEYHATDPDEVKRNIDGTKAYVVLAHDVGATGVKVRPNGVQIEAGVPLEQTLSQIGTALNECGAFAEDFGIEIRLEVHGGTTSDPGPYSSIMETADHPNVKVCWNSNMNDIVDGSIVPFFEKMATRIGLVHITNLSNDGYPWKGLFKMLDESGYDGFTLAEVPESPEPERFMGYYRALWQAYQP